MKIALIAPIPIEFDAAKKILGLKESIPRSGCRSSNGMQSDYEILCILSGPGKIRAAQAVTAFIKDGSPDIIVDAGTCAGLREDAGIGDIILGHECFEFIVGGEGLPRRSIKEMRLPSAFAFLPIATGKTLTAEACVSPAGEPYHVMKGIQVSGEILINSHSWKERLAGWYHASGANWETAAVFVSALRASVPAISFRAVSDFGDELALKEFKLHARTASNLLFQHIDRLITADWFNRFRSAWEKVSSAVKAKMPASVRPCSL